MSPRDAIRAGAVAILVAALTGCGGGGAAGGDDIPGPVVQAPTVIAELTATHIPNGKLRQCILDTAVARGWTERAQVTELVCTAIIGNGIFEPINNITGLELFPNLQVLRVLMDWRVTGGVNVDSSLFLSVLTPLRNLTALRVLELHFTDMRDVSALAALTNLEQLLLPYHHLTDVTGLRNLTRMRVLDLTVAGGFNPFRLTSIGALANLTALEELYLADNFLTDITALTNATNLVVLDLTRVLSPSVLPLSNHNALRVLVLDSATPGDLDATLATLPLLQYLDITGSTGPLPAGVGAMSQLVVLWASPSDIEALAGMTSLRELHVPGLTLLAPLTRTQGIEYLDLSFAVGMQDLDALGSLTSLQVLDLYFSAPRVFHRFNWRFLHNLTALTDLSPPLFDELSMLDGHPSLRNVYIWVPFPDCAELIRYVTANPGATVWGRSDCVFSTQKRGSEQQATLRAVRTTVAGRALDRISKKAARTAR